MQSIDIADIKITFLDKSAKKHQNLVNDNISEPMEPGDTEDIKYETVTDDDTNKMLKILNPGQFERELYADENQETFFVGASPSL